MDTVTAMEAANTLGVRLERIYELKQAGQIRAIKSPAGVVRSSCLRVDDVRSLLGTLNRTMPYQGYGTPVTDVGFTLGHTA